MTVECCYACDKPLRADGEPFKAWTLDGQMVYVGPECYTRIRKAHTDGYQPPLGGPRLYTHIVYRWLTRKEQS